MKKPHRDNAIEINYLPGCSISYKIHNCRFKVRKGSAVAFWSFMPHHILGFDKDYPYYALNIPVSILHEWNLPRTFVDNLFRGEVQAMPNLEDALFATERFKKWAGELEHEDAVRYSDCQLEIGAYLKRLAFRLLAPDECKGHVEADPACLAETMAMFISNNFTEPIKVSDVAKEVGLNPDYANSIFKKAFNSTISNYITDQRVLYAKRKLTNTDESITSLAYQCGFNSICRFNVAFKKKTRLTPREFRKGHLWLVQDM